jgi:hypothetical protein
MIILLMGCFCRLRERFAQSQRLLVRRELRSGAKRQLHCRYRRPERTPYSMARMERFESLSGLSGSCEGR